MPRRTKDNTPPPTSAPDQPSVVIREQISQMAPVTREELDSAAPTNTDVTDIRPRGPNGRLLRADGTERARRNVGPRRPRTPGDSNPLMDDPRYVEAIQGLNFYGAPRVIKRSFAMGAQLMKDSEIALNADEERHVDNYFYALSKHMTFDPMAHLMGRILLFILLMGELVMWRYLKYSPFGKHLKQLLKPDDDSQETPPDDNSTVM